MKMKAVMIGAVFLIVSAFLYVCINHVFARGQRIWVEITALNGSGIKGERHTCMPIVCFVLILGCNVFEIVKDTCIW